MAVFAPGDTPDPGTGDQNGFMAWLSGLPGQAQASILRSMNYANPVQPAAADTLTNNGSPLNNPSPVPQALAGGGPPVPPAVLGGGQPPAPMPPDAPTPPLPASGGSSGGGGNSQSYNGPSILPQARGVMPVMGPPQSPTPWFHGSNTPYAPNPAIGAPPPPRPAVSNPAVARGSNRPAGARIPSTATASVPPAGSPFTVINRPNMGPAPIYDQQGNPTGPVSGGALARGGGPPLMTALDLSRLFGGGGGGGQAAPAAAARPAATIPASATASVPPDVTGNAPWNYGPYQKSVVRTPGQPYGPIYPRAPATSNF
jgi:hypothetical protein